MKREFLTTVLLAAALSAFVAYMPADAEAGQSKKERSEAIAKLQSVKESYAASIRHEALQAKSSTEGVRVTGPASQWLTKVSADRVNMVTNRLEKKGQDAISIDGRTYYGTGAAYANSLKNNPSARFASDPVTGNKVDKASAAAYADASGRVFYFESEDSYRNFVGLASPETVYGYSEPR